MRTTVNIDDDVLDAIRELARRKRLTMGQILSDLARQSLVTSRQIREMVSPYFQRLRAASLWR